MMAFGVVAALVVGLGILRRPPQQMKGMKFLWPIHNLCDLCADMSGVWAYWAIGQMGRELVTGSAAMDKPMA